MATDDAASAPRTRRHDAVALAAHSPTSKMDGTRAPVAASDAPVGPFDAMEEDDTQRRLLDVEAMLSTMKQSAQQLDGMLQRIYAAQATSTRGEEADRPEEEEEDTASALQPVEALVSDATLVACETYFEAIRASFVGAHDDVHRRVAHRALRGLLSDAGGADQKLPTRDDATAFVTSTQDVTYMFPAPVSHYTCGDTMEEEWDMAEALTRDQFEQRVAQCLDRTDHAVPSAISNAIATLLAQALGAFSAGECELKAIAAFFPVARVVADTHVEWRRGNRICKVHATERDWKRQWGLEVVMKLETVARAQGLAVAGDIATALLGPPLSCTVECRTFVPKAQYNDATPTTRDQLTCASSLQLTLAVEGDGAASTKLDHEATAVVDEKPTVTKLPEFLDVWHWGGHAVLSSSGESSTAIPGTFDTSMGFQKLAIRTPFPRNRIVQAACGRLHTLLLNDMGMVFSYGHAMDGALGHGDAFRPTEIVVAQPKLLDFFFERAIPIQSIACGGDDLTGFHSACVARDGSVFTWGVGLALGLGSVKSHSTPQRVDMPVLQREPSDTTDAKVVSIACGSGFCIALASDGSALAWGKWSDGRLGLGAIPILNKSARQNGSRRQLQRFQLYPKRLECHANGSSTPVRWRQVSCGDAHCVALSTAGVVHVWGRGRQGQLGLGDVRDAMTPMALLSKKEWCDVAAGQDWSMAVDTHGAVWSWGACGAAVLGLSSDGDDADRSAAIAELLLQKHFQLRQQSNSISTSALAPPPRFHWLRPQLIPSLSHGDAAIRRISAGARHAAAISERGDLYVWGSPRQGLPSQPTLVVSSSCFSSATGIGTTITEQVFCGGSHVVALTSGSFLANAMQHVYSALQSPNATEGGAQEEHRPPVGADVVLIVGGGRALFAHKLVLARRSAVLRELILNEERPLGSGVAAATPSVTEVLLPQLRLEIARVVLEFLYTDNLTTSLDPLSYLVRDVLRAAREYKIPRLARICRARIASASYVSLAAALLVELGADEAQHHDEVDEEDDRSLCADLAFAFGDTTWSDLHIVAEDRVIPVHKCMLLARSEYFRALLAFYEKQDDADRSFAVRELVAEESYLGMLRVLQFIYNDELTTVSKQRSSPSTGNSEAHDEGEDHAAAEERTEQLLEDLIAADKYGLVRMKRLCEHHIRVTHTNCLDVLVVADLVHADHLKQAALAFVQTNLHVLSVASGPANVLQRLAREFPHLLTELYDRIQRTTQQQTALREWQRHVERDASAHHARQAQQWQQTSDATPFPWVPLILAFVFATLYLSVMNAHESDYPVVPAINVVVVGGLLVAAFAGKI